MVRRKSIYVLTLILSLILSTGSVFAGSYTVQSGDSLWKIAQQNDVTVNDLVKLNQIKNPNLIFPGQMLKLTADTAAPLTGGNVKSEAVPVPDKPVVTPEKAKPEVIAVKKDIDPNAGADSYANGGDHPASKYYVNPDFYNMKSDNELTIISNFKTYQQTSEWSCGNATALMVLEHFGVHDFGEWDIAVKSNAGVDVDVPGSLPGSANNFPEYGTSVDDMVRFFNGIKGFKIVETSYKADYKTTDLIAEGDTSVPQSEWGNLPGKFESVALYASENDPNTDKWVDDAKDSYFVKWVTGNLKANRPIMVEWADWDGHWQAIIGYDTNGTPGLGDDVIIFADPYDTSDSWQDGYYYYPAERWFYMWNDRAVAPKPYQLQPYIIVEPVK